MRECPRRPEDFTRITLEFCEDETAQGTRYAEVTLHHRRYDLFDDLQEIPQRYPENDLALFHLGGTRIMGMLLTMDAEQGVEAIRLIDPREVIPIHYNDYEVFESPLEDFKQAIAAAGFEERVSYLSHGRRTTSKFRLTDGCRPAF